MKTRTSPSCGCCGSVPDGCRCATLPDEILVATGVISSWQVMNLDTPFNQNGLGQYRRPWTGCTQVPSSFILQRTTTTIAGPTAAWTWSPGLSSQYWVRDEVNAKNCTLHAWLGLFEPSGASPTNCFAIFWMGLLGPGMVLDADTIYRQTIPAEPDHVLSVFMISGNSGLYNWNETPGTFGLTEGDLDTHFRCGNGDLRWFSISHYGFSYFPGHYEDQLNPENWETHVMSEADYLGDPLILIPPLCFGTDTKTITFTAL